MKVNRLADMSLQVLAQGSSSEDEEMQTGGIDDIIDEDNDADIVGGPRKQSAELMKPPLPIPSSTELSKPPVRITPLVSYARGESDSDSDESDKEEFDLNLLYKQRARLQDQIASTPSGGVSPASVDEADPNQEDSSESRVATPNSSDQVKLPPEPEGRCSRSLQDKIARMLERKKLGKLSLNEHVQQKKDFRNPSIYEKLVSYCSIDEYGTNYPRNLFNPSSWGVESYYDALAKAQKEAHDKKEKEKHKKGQVEFIKATKKISVPGVTVITQQGSDEKQKTSKWDAKPSEEKKHSMPATSEVPVKKQKSSS